jgi:hypothetical protein
MALTIVTNPVTPIGTTTATCGGNTISGTGTISAKGVCYKISSTPVSPTISDSTLVASGTANTDFTSNLTGLTSGSTYYIRAYVTTSGVTSYGATVVFTTLGLTTTAATPITSTTATSGAYNISGFSLGSISSSGVCWSTSATPTIGVSNFTLNTIIGSVFTSYITGLSAGTTYYVRSYITSGGTDYYGNQINFTTSSVLPIVTTTSTIASITINSATVSGNVSSDGGSSVTARGIQYSLLPNMTSPATSASGTGTGAFSATLTGLTLGTTYYVRAYATNTTGTSYGAIYNFTTLGGPLVETVIPYSITSSTAQVGCNILSIGGSVLTARGVVISTSPGPTLSTGSVFSDLYYGSAVPQYLVKLTSLTKDTTYYIRAYATNSQGTSYGEELIFSTTSCNPLVEDCNPQHEPPVVCSEPGCEYIIPLECVVGDIPTSSVSCSNISLTPDENTLLSELQKINEVLCTLSSRDFIIFYLTSIYNSDVLKTIFCDVKTRCTTIDATVLADSGSSNIGITAITPTTYVLIGRTITCGTGSKFTAGTKITGFISGGVNGGVGVYTISSPMLAAYTGSITLTFVP